jgi:hypothetical protein
LREAHNQLLKQGKSAVVANLTTGWRSIQVLWAAYSIYFKNKRRQKKFSAKKMRSFHDEKKEYFYSIYDQDAFDTPSYHYTSYHYRLTKFESNLIWSLVFIMLASSFTKFFYFQESPFLESSHEKQSYFR